MNKVQINRKEMHDAVLLFLDKNVQKWTSIPKIVEIKSELGTVNQQIEEEQAKQEASKVVIGTNKKNLKSTIADKADILNDIVEAYAGLNDMPDLESRMSDSVSSLLRMKNQEFIVKVQEIVKETENHQEVLVAEWGVTAEQVTDIKTDINRYQELNGMPSSYRIASRQATSGLDALFSEANDILSNRLDNVMKLFRRRDPNFYNGYIAARVIVDD